MYPSVPLLLVTWLSARFPTARVSIDLPADLADVLPVFQVGRFGGAGQVVSLDAANVDVDVWAADIGTAEHLAAQVQAALETEILGATVTEPQYGGTGTFSKQQTITGPSRRPTSSRGSRSAVTAVGVQLSRVGASYRLTVHSH